jgi:hypothetical protein
MRTDNTIRFDGLIVAPRRVSLPPPGGGVLCFGRSFVSWFFVSQVQREAQALAPHQARILSGGRDAGHRCLVKLGV